MTVLIIDEDPGTRVWLQHVLPWETRTAPTLLLGQFEAGNWQPSVIVVDGDQWLDGSRGIDAVLALKRNCPRGQVIVMVERHSQDEAGRALKDGAFGYAQKGDSQALMDLIWEARDEVPSVLAVASSLIH